MYIEKKKLFNFEILKCFIFIFVYFKYLKNNLDQTLKRLKRKHF